MHHLFQAFNRAELPADSGATSPPGEGGDAGEGPELSAAPATCPPGSDFDALALGLIDEEERRIFTERRGTGAPAP